MKKIILLGCLFIITSSMLRPSSSIELLKMMHEKYEGKWYKTFSFNQTTEFYRNDSLLRTQTWYENIQFPGNFRIDFGSPDSGNAVIFKNDSAYFFHQSKFANARQYDNDLLFILGGMYFCPLDSVMQRVKSYGYDLTKFHEDIWKGNTVYVIGADKNEDTVNQLWIEKEHYSPVRMLTFKNNTKEEALLENHVPLEGGFTETLVHFYIDNKLVQVEKYHDLKGNIAIDSSIFDEHKFVKLKH